MAIPYILYVVSSFLISLYRGYGIKGGRNWFRPQVQMPVAGQPECDRLPGALRRGQRCIVGPGCRST